MEGQRQTTFRFDGWTVNRDSGDLARGEHVTRLQIQPLQIFVELLENAGEVVTRERLIAKLWPKGIVEFDASLNTAVRKLRIALNDDPDQPRYIETIPRRGYRFIGKLEQDVAPTAAAPAPVTAPLGLVSAPIPTLAPAADTPIGALATTTAPLPTPIAAPPTPAVANDRRRRWMFVAVFVLTLVAAIGTATYWFSPRVAGPPVLAILPFNDIGPDGKDSALCLAIREELSIRLAQLPGVRIVASTSASAPAMQASDVREIGNALGATHIIEGSVRRSGDGIRVTVRLVNTDDGIPILSRPYDFSASDVRDVGQTLAQTVAQELKLILSPQQLQRWQARNARDPAAYEYFITAFEYGREKTADGDDKAGELYRLAIERDPEFAPAYAGLAEVMLGTMQTHKVPLAEIAGKVKALLAKAEELNPDMSELYAAQGWLAKEEGRFVDAEKAYRRAVQINPSDARSYSRLGIMFYDQGRVREALDLHTRASEIDPDYYLYPMYRCMVLQDIGNFAEGERACARARELAPEKTWPIHVTSWLEASRGNVYDALRWNQAASALAPNDGALAWHSIDIMLTLRLVSEARAAAQSVVTRDEAQVRLYQAGLELAEHGPAGLRAYLQQADMSALSGTSVAYEAVRYYQIAGELEKSRAALELMRPTPAYADDELFSPRQVRAGVSPGLVCASLLLAQGERKEGLELLDKLDALLIRLEANGMAHHGIDSLRAESLALRGKPDEAMRSLRRAVSRGWRASWRAETEPFLASLRERADFKALIVEVEARNDEMRARFHNLKASR